MKIYAELTFDKGYIADPYWPQRERLIDIQKKSGYNRARTMKGREKALADYLGSIKVTKDDYDLLMYQASRPFYTLEDVVSMVLQDGRNYQEIVISAHQMYGCLAQAASLISAPLRLAKAEQIRTVIQVSDFMTGKTAQDGVWERFAVVKAGTGNKLSNQRSLRSNPYIAGFTARGEINWLGDEIKPVQVFLDWAGRDIGVGACRKMGWGRFTIALKEAD